MRIFKLPLLAVLSATFGLSLVYLHFMHVFWVACLMALLGGVSAIVGIAKGRLDH